MTIPTLQTDRLTLRLPQLEDAKAIFTTYAQDPEVTKYLTWSPHSGIETTNMVIANLLQATAEGNKYPWAIVRTADNRLLGMIDLRVAGYKAEFGYVLGREFWGQGIMTEALQAVVSFAFDELGLYRIGALCDVDNPASARVMEKAGLSREGILKRYSIHPNVSPEPRDMLSYAITR